MSYPAFQKVGKKLLPPPLLQHATESSNTRNKQFEILLEKRKWPEEGWDDTTIEIFMNELAVMDTNNFMIKPSGVGEREGRIYSSLVRRRCYGLSHGVGRSGDLAESQPKAAGSSLISSLTNDLLLDFLQTNIGRDVKEASLFPMATGMTMTLILLTLARLKPKSRFVLWLRHDQKSVFKSILTAGLTPIIIDPILENEQLVTNVEAIRSVISSKGRENILCIISTTSCFAPRACDDLRSLREFKFGTRALHKNCESTIKCSRHFGGADDTCGQDLIYHVVNNAYGMQSKLILKKMQKALSHIDLFIQSTDKNLLVPVGGCILGSPLSPSPNKSETSLLTKVRKNYAGRASSYPATDVLLTILTMGRKGFQDLLSKREDNYQYLKTKMEGVAKKYGQRVLAIERNDISIGISLNFPELNVKNKGEELVTSIGGMMFKRNVTGSRVVPTNSEKNIDGFIFKGWGAHHPNYPVPYMTAAAAIGMERREVDHFIEKLDECLSIITVRKGNDSLKLMVNGWGTDHEDEEGETNL